MAMLHSWHWFSQPAGREGSSLSPFGGRPNGVEPSLVVGCQNHVISQECNSLVRRGNLQKVICGGGIAIVAPAKKETVVIAATSIYAGGADGRGPEEPLPADRQADASPLLLQTQGGVAFANSGAVRAGGDKHEALIP